jgi:hypothetical protein
MTRIVLDPVELRRVAGLLGTVAGDTELTDTRLRGAPIPELPATLGSLPSCPAYGGCERLRFYPALL